MPAPGTGSQFLDRVLRILREHGPMLGGDMAARLWPKSGSSARGQQSVARHAARHLYRLQRQGKAVRDFTGFWRAQ
jgi:hypothetical protein